MADFEKLYAENSGFIYKYLLKLCKNPSTAEELTQETFFKAYINISKLKTASAAPAWLCTIARNTYFAWYKQSKRSTPLEDVQLVDTAPSVEETVIRQELAETAQACLCALEEPYKQVLMLSVYGGLSLKEISASFGKSESWARVTLYRAKQKLTERMR